MREVLKLLAGATIALAGLGAASSASALVNGNIVITVDENGNGTIDGFAGLQGLPSGFQDDPGPGGLNGVLTYDMLGPPGLVAGDVLLQEAGGILDVVRFNPDEFGPGGGQGSLLFYSDNLDGYDDLADTSGPPGVLYPNFIIIPEGTLYTPGPGQPGFVTGASAPVVYDLISDVANVPEPATWGLLLVGFGAMGAALRSRRKPLLA